MAIIAPQVETKIKHPDPPSLRVALEELYEISAFRYMARKCMKGDLDALLKIAEFLPTSMLSAGAIATIKRVSYRFKRSIDLVDGWREKTSERIAP